MAVVLLVPPTWRRRRAAQAQVEEFVLSPSFLFLLFPLLGQDVPTIFGFEALVSTQQANQIT